MMMILDAIFWHYYFYIFGTLILALEPRPHRTLDFIDLLKSYSWSKRYKIDIKRFSKDFLTMRTDFLSCFWPFDGPLKNIDVVGVLCKVVLCIIHGLWLNCGSQIQFGPTIVHLEKRKN